MPAGVCARSSLPATCSRAADKTSVVLAASRHRATMLIGGVPVTATREIVTWDDVAMMCRTLASRLAAERFDAILGIARGGLVPAALLAQELALRDVLVASVASYEGERRGDTLHFLEFPPDQAVVGRRILVVDDIWDSGRTAELVRRRILEAGGQPIIAVLHYKPEASHFPDRRPDYSVEDTDAWIQYPWERDP